MIAGLFACLLAGAIEIHTTVDLQTVGPAGRCTCVRTPAVVRLDGAGVSMRLSTRGPLGRPWQTRTGRTWSGIWQDLVAWFREASP